MQIDWGWWWCLVVTAFSSQTLAAWVQAGGAILGIWAAYRLAKAPIKHAAQERRETVLAIVEAAHQHTQEIRKAVENMDWKRGNAFELYRTYNKALIDGLVRTIQSVPMHELGTGRGVLVLLRISNQLVYLMSSIENLLAGPHQNPIIAKALESFAKEDYEEKQNAIEAAYIGLKIAVTKNLDKIDEDVEALKSALRGG